MPEMLPARIQVRILIAAKNQQYMAFLDRRVHKSVQDFLSYLSQTMPVVSTSVLVKLSDHLNVMSNLDSVVENEILVLKSKDDHWNPPQSLLFQQQQRLEYKKPVVQ